MKPMLTLMFTWWILRSLKQQRLKTLQIGGQKVAKNTKGSSTVSQTSSSDEANSTKKLSKKLRKIQHLLREAKNAASLIKNDSSPKYASFADLCDMYLGISNSLDVVDSIRAAVQANGGRVPENKILPNDRKPNFIRL
jgi:hypothetical protein